MIKSITTVRLTKSAKDFNQLSVLFDSLGFERGHGWKDGHSSGAPFLAPIGSIEFVVGKAPAEGDLLVEVSDLDSVHAQVNRAKVAHAKVSDIRPTHWKSRYFTFELEKTIKVSFWSFDA